MIMVKYGEIPIREFLRHHTSSDWSFYRSSEENGGNEANFDNSTNRSLNSINNKYHLGIKNFNNDNVHIMLELYYIEKCKELKDDINFVSR